MLKQIWPVIFIKPYFWHARKVRGHNARKVPVECLSAGPERAG